MPQTVTAEAADPANDMLSLFQRSVDPDSSFEPDQLTFSIASANFTPDDALRKTAIELVRTAHLQNVKIMGNTLALRHMIDDSLTGLKIIGVSQNEMDGLREELQQALRQLPAETLDSQLA